MESQLSNSVIVLIGFVFFVHAVLVESRIVLEGDKNEGRVLDPPPPAPLRSPPPPLKKTSPPPPPRLRSQHGHSRRRRASPPPPPKQGLNVGKRVGILFAGIVAMMQICFAGFLVYKRRQLFWVSRADRKNRS